MWSFLAFASLFFWVCLALETVFIFYCVHRRRGYTAAISLAIVLFALQVFGGIPIIQYVIDNPLQILLYAALYLVIALFWSVTKWWFFVKDNHQRYNELFSKFINNTGYNPKEFSSEQKIEWKRYFDENKGYQEDDEYHFIEFKPSISKHRSDVITWMMFWPFSMLWTLLNDPITKFFKMLYRFSSQALQSITESVWRGTEDHMPSLEEINASLYKKEKK